MIDYIEENLTNKIEYKDLAKIVGISDYSLQRIFTFLTGISISEYIRKRRLSKAYLELKTSKIKIIDLAIKYNYESSISFSRAFKQQFNITPKECRKSPNNNYLSKEINYEIEYLEEKTLYCYHTKDEIYDDILYKIRDLYRKMDSEFLKTPRYGIFITDNIYHYYIGSEKKHQNTEKIIIEAGKYLVFEVGSKNQKDILNTYKYIYKVILNEDYKLIDRTEIEFYKDNNCYIYLRILDKQNKN